MAKLVVNYNGGTSDEYATFKGLNEAFTGQVFKGFDVVPNSTPNMTIKVNTGSGRIPTGTVPSDYYYMVSHDTTAGESVTIATAAASPRIDYIVAYIDKGVTASASPVNNANNVLKFAAVAGTPSGSPVVPTVGQIQTAIGAANPYIILAQIAVAASATTITTPNITDLRVASIVRQNNGTNVGLFGAKIQTGWVAIPVATTSPGATASVTFPVAFTNIPIVIATYGGDTAGATSTLGAGGPNIQGATAQARSVTTSGFSATASTLNASATWTTGNTVYIQWVAIGL